MDTKRFKFRSQGPDVFFICYKEKKAVEEAIKSIRKFHPLCSIYITSDGGMDFSYLSNYIEPQFKAVVEPEQTVGVTKNIEKMIQENKFPIVQLFMASVEFLKRLKKACDFITAEWILLMEPDVYVRGPLHIPDHPLVGPKPNKWPDHVGKYLVDHGGIDNKAWGAAAGIMHRKTFLKIADDLLEHQEKILDFLYIDPRIACYDYLLAFIFSLYGYRYEENPDLTECKRNPEWRTSGHPLLHQYMENYEEGTNKHAQGGNTLIFTPHHVTVK